MIFSCQKLFSTILQLFCFYPKVRIIDEHPYSGWLGLHSIVFTRVTGFTQQRLAALGPRSTHQTPVANTMFRAEKRHGSGHGASTIMADRACHVRVVFVRSPLPVQQSRHNYYTDIHSASILFDGYIVQVQRLRKITIHPRDVRS